MQWEEEGSQLGILHLSYFGGYIYLKDKIEFVAPESLIEHIKLEVLEEGSRRIDADDVMSIRSAAALLGISDSSAYAIIRDNPDFPTVRLGRRIKIIRSEMIN